MRCTMNSDDYLLDALNSDVFSIIISYLDRISWCQLINSNKRYYNILYSLIVHEPGILTAYKALKTILKYEINQIVSLLHLTKNPAILHNIYCIGLVLGKENFYKIAAIFDSITFHEPDKIIDISDADYNNFLIFCGKSLMNDYQMWDNTVRWCVKNNIGCELLEIGPDEVKHLVSKYKSKYCGVINSELTNVGHLVKWGNWKESLTNCHADRSSDAWNVGMGAIRYNNIDALQYCLAIFKEYEVYYRYDDLLMCAAKRANLSMLALIKTQMHELDVTSSLNVFVFAHDEQIVQRLITMGFTWIADKNNVENILTTNRRHPKSKLINYAKYFSNLSNWKDFKNIIDNEDSNKIFSKLADMYNKNNTTTPNGFWTQITSTAQIDILLSKGFIISNRFIGTVRYDVNMNTIPYIFELTKNEELSNDELDLAIELGSDVLRCALVVEHNNLKSYDYVTNCDDFNIIKILYDDGFKINGGSFLMNWICDINTNLYAYRVLGLGMEFTINSECLNKMAKKCNYNMIKNILSLPGMRMAVKEISELTERVDKKTFKLIKRMIQS